MISYFYYLAYDSDHFHGNGAGSLTAFSTIASVAIIAGSISSTSIQTLALDSF